MRHLAPLHLLSTPELMRKAEDQNFHFEHVNRPRKFLCEASQDTIQQDGRRYLEHRFLGLSLVASFALARKSNCSAMSSHP